MITSGLIRIQEQKHSASTFSEGTVVLFVKKSRLKTCWKLDDVSLWSVHHLEVHNILSIWHFLMFCLRTIHDWLFADIDFLLMTNHQRMCVCVCEWSVWRMKQSTQFCLMQNVWKCHCFSSGVLIFLSSGAEHCVTSHECTMPFPPSSDWIRSKGRSAAACQSPKANAKHAVAVRWLKTYCTYTWSWKLVGSHQKGLAA